MEKPGANPAIPTNLETFMPDNLTTVTATRNGYSTPRASIQRFTDTADSRLARQGYLSINDAVGFLMELSGLGRKDRATLAAIHRVLPDNLAPYESVKRSNLSIGLKLSSLRSEDSDRLRRSAAEALNRLFEVALPSIGFQLIERSIITNHGEVFDQKPTDEYFSYVYVDNAVPAAQAAIERAKGHPDWRRSGGQERQEILRGCCQWALDNLIPPCAPQEQPEGTDNDGRLSCEAYARLTEAQLDKLIEVRLEKIASEYKDPERASEVARYLSRKLGDKANSFLKFARTQTKAITVSSSLPASIVLTENLNSYPEKKNSVIFNLGTDSLAEEIPPTTPTIPISTPKQEGGGGTNFDPLPTPYPKQTKKLNCTIPADSPAKQEFQWVPKILCWGLGVSA